MPEHTPLVSIVLCSYNGEKFLSQQIDSLLAQTYPNFEVIISDDRSTDSTPEIIKGYAAKDPRIRLHLNPVNLGYNENFEQAFRLAQGQLIAVCDQDDVWRKDKVEIMVPLFVNEHTLLAHCKSVRFTTELPTACRYTKRNAFDGNTLAKLMLFNTVAGHNIIFKRPLLDHIPSFPPGVFYDWWLVIIAAIHGEVRSVDDILTYHRSHDSNLTLGKKDEKKQTRSKYLERVCTVEAMQRVDRISTDERKLARKLVKKLHALDKKRFSFSLFVFLALHASTFFFFKKNFFSRIKMAYRMSFAI